MAQVRDGAVARKNATLLQLAHTRIELMQANSQLMEAIQQKVELSQQLDQWQVSATIICFLVKVRIEKNITVSCFPIRAAISKALTIIIQALVFSHYVTLLITLQNSAEGNIIIYSVV